MRKLYFLLIVFLIDRYFKDFSSLSKTINPGISFSIKFDTGILFLLFGILIIILTLVIKNLSLKSYKFTIGFWFVILGGLSNLLDRVIYGGVVDYLNFFGLLKNNFADYLIFIGVLMLVLKIAKPQSINSPVV